MHEICCLYTINNFIKKEYKFHEKTKRKISIVMQQVKPPFITPTSHFRVPVKLLVTLFPSQKILVHML